ncbi:MAG: glycosyltransferase family 2 protein [Gammaproteobacteria bacterium]
MSTGSPRLSVAAPVYNEVEILPELIRRLDAVLDELPGGPHEIVIVDDGSTDGTRELLLTEIQSRHRLVAVALSRNFGHQAALSAALDHAGGDAVVLMDGDLQDAPEEIPEFVARYREGYDVVYAQSSSRKEGLLHRLAYAAAYRIIAGLSSVALPLDAGDFGLMSRRVVDQLRDAPERQRYLRGLRAWVGFRQIGVPVHRAERAAGRSKYSWSRLFGLAFDGLFSFSVAPLRAAALLGFLAIALSSAFAVYSIVARLLFDRVPQGFTALIVVMTFLSGMNLLFLGLLGEYLGRVYEEVKRRPLYVAERVLRRSPDASVARSESLRVERAG